MYKRREKDTTSLQFPIDSSKLGNVPLSSLLPTNEPSKPDDDLPITLRKGKCPCTNHPIFNFVSYQSLNISYTSYVNSISSIKIPSNLKEAIFQSKWGEAMCGNEGS